jgi:hypothetical protein
LKFLLPLLFFIWANLHGGFAIGLALLCLHFISFWREGKTIHATDGIIFISSVLITLINPYGLRLWHEIWMSLSDSNLRWAIAEWQPFYTSLEPSFWLLAGLVFSFGYIFRKRIPQRQYLFATVTLIAGIMSVRMMPIFALVAVRFVYTGFKLLAEDIRKNSEAVRRSGKAYTVLGIVVGIFFILNTGGSTYIMFKNPPERMYPYGAVHFLATRQSLGKIYAPYDWGGFLEWQIPGNRFFIDGRMPSWRWQSPYAGESNWAFKEYLHILTTGDYTAIFAKYRVNTVIWYSHKSASPLNILYNSFARFFNQKSDIVFDFPGGLTEKGWTRVYDDGVTVVYQKL